MEWGYGDAFLYAFCTIKRKPFRCEDGSIVLIYKNPEDFLKETLNDVGLGIKLSFNALSYPEIEAQYGVKPSFLKARVDQVIEQTKLNMKALYETYSLRPCDKENHSLFQQSLLKVIDQGAILRTLDETIKQVPTIEDRYNSLKELANSNLKGNEVEKAKKAVTYSKDEYLKNAPLEIIGLVNESEKNLSELKSLLRKDPNQTKITKTDNE